MDENNPENSFDPQSPMGVDEGSESRDFEEPMEVNSPVSEGGSDYEDAPSRLEESKLEPNEGNNPSIDKNESPDRDGSAESGETNESLSNSGNYDSPHQEVSFREDGNPGIGDETIYASASESFTEVDNRLASLNEDDSYSEVASEDNVDDTKDPLGLDDESNDDVIDEKEEGETEEGELNRDDDGSDQTKAAAYQTEPVSSDDDLDVQDNGKSNSIVNTPSGNPDNATTIEVSKQTAKSTQFGHRRPDNDLNHEDHVELDYEEDLDEADKLRGDVKVEDDEKVRVAV